MAVCRVRSFADRWRPAVDEARSMSR